MRTCGWLRRVVQAVFLILFGAFLWIEATWTTVILSMDPLAALVLPVAVREFLPILIPGIIVIATAFIFGRAFCGWICPLGTTVDMIPWLNKSKKPRITPRIKYLLLAALLVLALTGISLVLFSAPLALAGRLYGLIVIPTIINLTDLSLAAFRPLFTYLEMDSLSFADLDSLKFSTLTFQVLFFAALLGFGALVPRFWCRYLCPAGALLGICATKSVIRRRVNPDPSAGCKRCGLCARVCPTGAIPENDPLKTKSGECILCLKCKDVCPVSTSAKERQPNSPKAIGFFKRPGSASKPSGDKDLDTSFLPGRRLFLFSAGCGLALGAAGNFDLYHGYGQVDRSEPLLKNTLIRPPGSVSEKRFLALCIRCGACMAACPSNMLHPAALEAGPFGTMSPIAIPRRGPCNPHCRSCGMACPTGAIRLLEQEERMWAKMGTAVITRSACLAWNDNKSCMVCDESCPYDAVEVIKTSETTVPAPIVHTDRCAGCGFCEMHCPVEVPAIVVNSAGALRLDSGSFITAGKDRGLSISLKSSEAQLKDPQLPASATPPGFDP